jgi:hypothetical protein
MVAGLRGPPGSVLRKELVHGLLIRHGFHPKRLLWKRERGRDGKRKGSAFIIQGRRLEAKV